MPKPVDCPKTLPLLLPGCPFCMAVFEGLQRRLIGRADQPSAVGSGIVDKLPLVVFPLFVKLANRGLSC